MNSEQIPDSPDILREILDVLRRHGINPQTVNVDVSMKPEDFQVVFPNPNETRWLRVAWPTIDNVPTKLYIKRRYPFEESMAWLDEHVRPVMAQYAETLKQDFGAADISFEAGQHGSRHGAAHFGDLTYRIKITCRFTDNRYKDYNTLELCVLLNQLDAVDYPLINLWIGWWVDLEGNDEWGLETVSEIFGDNAEATPKRLLQLERSLPRMYNDFRREIERKFLTLNPPQTPNSTNS